MVLKARRKQTGTTDRTELRYKILMTACPFLDEEDIREALQSAEEYCPHTSLAFKAELASGYLLGMKYTQFDLLLDSVEKGEVSADEALSIIFDRTGRERFRRRVCRQIAQSMRNAHDAGAGKG